MKTNFKKCLLIICIVCLTAAFTTACGNNISSSTTDNNVTANNTDNNASTGTNLMGQVTAIDGNSVTLVGSTMKGGNRGNGNFKSDGTQPSGDPGNAKGGTPPSVDPSATGMPDGQRDFAANGEESTVVIEDESIISIQNGNETTSGTLADIQVGTMLRITYDKNKNIESIIVMNQGNFPGGNSDPQATNTADNAA